MKSMQELNPNWNNPDKATTNRKELRDYAISHGFKDEEIAQFGKDERIVLALSKALRFDKMMSAIIN